MFLGRYDFDGDPEVLLEGYERLMADTPDDSVPFHVCIRRISGISIYDCCPDADVFTTFSVSTELREMLAASGLPEPTVTPLGEVHVARAGGRFVR